VRVRLVVVAALAATLATLIFVGGGSAAPPPKLPRGFFGIAPQTVLTPEDVRYMRAGGLESMRMPIAWSVVQPRRDGPYDWSSIDATIETASRGGLEILPFLAGTPKWLGRETTLPVHNARQRSAWTAFVKAAVARYGPGGEFWRLHRTEGVNYEPAITVPKPVRTWQIWNEANFFYFAFPVSPRDYAQLLALTRRAIKSVQPGAKILLTGLFGRPNAKGAKGMPAATFLEQLYRVPGVKANFDYVALHTYAVDAE